MSAVPPLDAIKHAIAWLEGADPDGVPDAATVIENLRRAATAHSLLMEAARNASAALAEAHDTHIYDWDDEHPEDCRYCAVTAELDAALAGQPAEVDSLVYALRVTVESMPEFHVLGAFGDDNSTDTLPDLLRVTAGVLDLIKQDRQGDRS